MADDVILTYLCNIPCQVGVDIWPGGVWVKNGAETMTSLVAWVAGVDV